MPRSRVLSKNRSEVDNIDIGFCLAVYELNQQLIDRQLACAPFFSPEGQAYFAAMKASVNFAFANRHCVLKGSEKGMEQSFGSACHGAGRALSRHAAKKAISRRSLKDALNAQGIVVECIYQRVLAEEAPQAYENIDEVVEVIHEANLAQKVARLRPIAVIKGD